MSAAMGHFRILYYSVAILVGAAFLTLAISRFPRQPVRGRWSFVVFYSLSLAHLGTVLFATYSMTNLSAVFSLQGVWAFARLVNRARYVALLVFAHGVARTRFSLILTIVTSAGVLAGTVLAPIILAGEYPIYVLAASLVYVLVYGAMAYRSQTSRSDMEQRRLRALLIYGALSIPFLLIDLLATVSLLPAGASVAVVDVVPLFVLGFGLLYILTSEVRRTEKPAVLRGHHQEALQRKWILCGLSKREIEVVHLVLAGCSNQQIASRLFISDSTVKKHMNHIFAKLKVGSRWELVRFLGVAPSGESTS